MPRDPYLCVLGLRPRRQVYSTLTRKCLTMTSPINNTPHTFTILARLNRLIITRSSRGVASHRISHTPHSLDLQDRLKFPRHSPSLARAWGSFGGTLFRFHSLRSDIVGIFFYFFFFKKKEAFWKEIRHQNIPLSPSPKKNKQKNLVMCHNYVIWTASIPRRLKLANQSVRLWLKWTDPSTSVALFPFLFWYYMPKFIYFLFFFQLYLCFRSGIASASLFESKKPVIICLDRLSITNPYFLIFALLNFIYRSSVPWVTCT